MNRTKSASKPAAEPEMTPARAMELAREILAKSHDPYWKDFRARVEASLEDRHRAAEAILSSADAPDDDPPGAVDEALRSLDEGRPHRPLFRHLE